MKVTGYKLVSAQDPDQLNPVIAQLIDDGWEPYGSPLCQHGGLIIQGMIKPVIRPPKGIEVEEEPRRGYVRRKMVGSRLTQSD